MISVDSAEQKAAQQRHRQRQRRIKGEPRRQALAGLQIEENLVQQIDGGAHDSHHQAGDGADQHRQRDQTRFPRPYEGAQPPRYLESPAKAHQPKPKPPIGVLAEIDCRLKTRGFHRPLAGRILGSKHARSGRPPQASGKMWNRPDLGLFNDQASPGEYDATVNWSCHCDLRRRVIVCLAVIPLFAQTGLVQLQGAAAFGDWRADHPGTQRLIRPQDLPAPDLAASAGNFVRIVHRTNDQKPIVPNGFEVNLFASGLAGPRLIRVAPERRCIRRRKQRGTNPGVAAQRQ